VQADPVLEGGVLLVVEVDPDVVLAHDLHQAVRSDPEGQVQEVELVLRGQEIALSVGRRAAHEHDVGQPLDPASPREEAIGDRQWQRTPDGDDALGRVRDQRVERDEPVEVGGVDALKLAPPLLEVVMRVATHPGDRLGEEAERRCGQIAEQTRRDDLGPEDDDDVRAELLERRHQGPRVRVVAKVDEAGVERRVPRAEGARLEVGALADQREAQPFARRGHAVGEAGAVEGRTQGHERDLRARRGARERLR
jgi:hypothetical protein